MRRLVVFFLIASVITMISLARAQPPGRPDFGQRDGGRKPDASSFIKRMMTFDANKDGQLSKAEITDERLLPLFERADENHDGIVTKEELTAIYAKELTPNRGMFGDLFGPGGPGGAGGHGPPPHGRPVIGEVMPQHVKDILRLSTAQRKKIDALQKLVDEKLEQILTDEQNQQLTEMRHRGPGGPGGPDGEPGRFGPPPDGPDGKRRRPLDDEDRPRRPPE